MRARSEVLSERLTCRSEEEFLCIAHPTTDDEHLGIQNGRQHGHSATEHESDFLERSERNRIPDNSCLGDVLAFHALGRAITEAQEHGCFIATFASDASSDAHECSTACILFPAAVKPASTSMPTALHLNVPHLSSDSVRPTHEFAVGDNATADPGSYRQQHHVPGAGTCPETVFGPRCGVGIVLENDREPGELVECSGHRDVRHREVWSHEQHVTCRIYEARYSNADGCDIVRCGQFANRVRHRLYDGVSAVRRGWDTCFCDDATRLVHDTGGHLRATKVHTDCQGHVDSFTRCAQPTDALVLLPVSLRRGVGAVERECVATPDSPVTVRSEVLMIETSEPAVALAEHGSLTDALVRNAEEFPERITLVRREGDAWIDTPMVEFHAMVRGVAKGLIANGIRTGDRVCIMSRTRYEWTILDYAIWYAGAVTVPIYETSSVDQMQWIMRDSGAVALVVETALHAQNADRVTETNVHMRWIIDAGALASLTESGLHVDDAEVDTRRAAVDWDDLATIVYTSGTTGMPKGCEITHRNLQYVATAGAAAIPEVLGDKTNSTLLFLPLAHIFGRAIQCIVVDQGLKLAHAPDAKNLVHDLAVFRPTFLLAVPRVFEKIYNGARQKAEADGKARIFDIAVATAIAYSRATERGHAPLGLTLRYKVFDRLVYSKIRANLGGRVRWAISGGAALGERLGHFYRGIGLIVLEGYGLTETSAPLTINRVQRSRIGSVGPALPGVSLRIADDGEILGKGDVVFRGYWNNPDASRAALEDGWFHTGDIGRIDDGYLFITGRKKELLVTANGKNVAPAPLEDRIRAHALVSQCLVIGDNRPYIAALVTLDPDAIGPWARAHGMSPDTTAADLVDDEQLRADIQHAVDSANKRVSQAESIRKFVILPTDWTELGGQLTPSLKVKRNIVMAEHAADIEALYGTR